MNTLMQDQQILKDYFVNLDDKFFEDFSDRKGKTRLRKRTIERIRKEMLDVRGRLLWINERKGSHVVYITWEELFKDLSWSYLSDRNKKVMYRMDNFFGYNYGRIRD